MSSATRPRLLDLFSGAGGAGMGYHRAGFDVTGVDIKPQKNYPFAHVVADALEYCAEHGREYDVIHASPPCQAYSVCTPVAYKGNHPDLIGPTRDVLRLIGRPYAIENVENARRHLVNPVMLCGTMFGLNIWRHRYFETWPEIVMSPSGCLHGDYPLPVLISGTTRRNTGRIGYPVAACREAAGVDWMTRAELDNAIPPVYTEWIGRQLLAALELEVGRV